MYQAGLLRVGLKMRKEPERDLERLVSETGRLLRLDPEGFRKYVHAHMQTLMATARVKRY